MSQTASIPVLQEAAQGRLKIIGLTVDQYGALIGFGKLPEDPTTELIDGLIIRKDCSKAGEDPKTVGDRHRIALLRLQHLLPQFEAHGCFLQSQQPIVLPPDNEPEPDIAVIRGAIDGYADRKPAAADVIFVLEVSDSSLRRDLGVKLRIYASAGIPEYIVIDLQNDLVIVHRTLQGASYGDVKRLRRDETLLLSTGAAQAITIAVSQLL